MFNGMFFLSYNRLPEWPFNSLWGSLNFHLNWCFTVFDMKLAGCMGGLDPPCLAEWVEGEVEVEVLKCSGQTESPVLRPRWGQREFLGCSGREQAGAQDLSNYTIWVTGELFICAVWHVSVDWGSCAVWKTDSAEVYLFILQAKQPNRTRNWKLES